MKIFGISIRVNHCQSQENLALDFELMSYMMLIISCLKVFQQALLKEKAAEFEKIFAPIFSGKSSDIVIDIEHSEVHENYFLNTSYTTHTNKTFNYFTPKIIIQ